MPLYRVPVHRQGRHPVGPVAALELPAELRREPNWEVRRVFAWAPAHLWRYEAGLQCFAVQIHWLHEIRP